MDVLKRIEELRRRKHNVKPRELESIAKAAGYTHDRTTGSHIFYVKEGVREPLPPIPRHSRNVNGWIVLRFLVRLEKGLLEEEEQHES
ncbi:MAG: type II toxin-antitoxin system HicA family toxin [Dehalococcoidia bacterium]